MGSKNDLNCDKSLLQLSIFSLLCMVLLLTGIIVYRYEYPDCPDSATHATIHTVPTTTHTHTIPPTTHTHTIPPPTYNTHI